MTHYRLEDDQKRLQELSDREAIDSLEDEIGLTRWLIEKSAARGTYGLTNSLLATVSRLSSSHQSAMIRASEQLSKSAVHRCAKSIVDIVCQEIDLLPLDDQQRNRCTDNIMSRVLEAVSSTENDDPVKKQPLRPETQQ